MKPLVWIGGRFPAPFSIEAPTPARPDVVVWLDATHDQLLVLDLAEPDPSGFELAEYLVAALEKPPRVAPTLVRVANRTMAEQIRGVLPAGIPIEVAPTPELDHVARLMFERLNAEPEAPSYLERGTIVAELLECMFRESATLHRLAPWKRLSDADVIQLDVPELAISGACVSIVGASKRNYGFLLFDSFSDYDEFASHAPLISRSKGKPLDFGTDFLSLGYESRTDVPDDMLAEVAEHGWVVAGERAYPVLLAVQRDGTGRSPVTRDVQAICAAAHAVTTLLSEHRAALSQQGAEPIVETMIVRTPAPIEVSLRFPHSALPPDPLSTEPISDAVRERDGELARAQVEAFVASPAVAHHPEDWLAAASFVCETLHRAKMDYLDERWDGLTPHSIEWFLLDHYPRKVSADAELVARTPEILDRYLEWLGETDRESKANVERIRARVARVGARFLKAAKDPGKHGPAKSFMMGMHAEGVDFSDPRAVAAYMDKYNRDLDAAAVARDRAAPRGERAVRKAPAKPTSPRWKPRANSPAPSANAECPCGSGKRYKRCCMAR